MVPAQINTSGSSLARWSSKRRAVWSEVGAGTEVELRLPANIVYTISRRRSWWSRLLGSTTPARVGDAP